MSINYDVCWLDINFQEDGALEIAPKRRGYRTYEVESIEAPIVVESTKSIIVLCTTIGLRDARREE